MTLVFLDDAPMNEATQPGPTRTLSYVEVKSQPQAKPLPSFPTSPFKDPCHEIWKRKEGNITLSVDPQYKDSSGCQDWGMIGKEDGHLATVSGF